MSVCKCGCGCTFYRERRESAIKYFNQAYVESPGFFDEWPCILCHQFIPYFDYINHINNCNQRVYYNDFKILIEFMSLTFFEKMPESVLNYLKHRRSEKRPINLLLFR